MAERCLGFGINVGCIERLIVTSVDVNWRPLMRLATFEKNLPRVHGNVDFALKFNSGFGHCNCSEIG